MPPTGVALRDVRAQLFDAAERVLLRDGPSGLTSRAVTDEAGVAKGVLHRHFADFDDFLAGFVLDRAHRIEATTLQPGSGDVVENLAAAIMAVFGSVAVAIVPLVTFRDSLRARLRVTWPAGVPVLTDAAELITDYLSTERELGRINEAAEPQFLGPMLIGSAHLLYADRTAAPPTHATVRKLVASSLGGALRQPK